MMLYLREILYLIGKDRKKLPLIVFFFLISSMLDLAGLGLIGPYITLIINPNLLAEGLIFDVIESVGLPLEKHSLLTSLSLILVGIFLTKLCPSF